MKDCVIPWLIVGGGIHGVHIAARLIGEAGVPAQDIRIIDPGESLLERWRTCTARTGMGYLRSPSVHHLGLRPWDLQHFAGKRRRRPLGLFAPPYDRPALALFNAHADQLIEDFGLAALHVRGRACHGAVAPDAVHIGLQDGRVLHAERAILALSASDEPHVPAWAPAGDPRITHIFATPVHVEPGESVAVVGGGITAAQVAIRLAREGAEVHLISRHAVREHQFDSEPGWLGPKLMAGFTRERDFARRRAIIKAARHRGSLPPDVARALRKAMEDGRVQRHETEVEQLEAFESSLTLVLNPGRLRVAKVVLATGFTPRRPGGAFVDSLIQSAALPCAPCGYPIVDRALRWHPRILTTGALAELELGPTARNIAGARNAGDRIVEGFRLAASA